jgi:hypothetical protein
MDRTTKMDEPDGLEGRPRGPRDELKADYLKAGRGICVGLLAGIPAGILVGGIGSRIAMRISALVGGEEIAGRLTENGNSVGEITLGGTAELIFFAGFFPGVFLGPLYQIIRGWLPGPVLVKGVLYGVLLLAVFGAVTINSGNPDFAELGPPGLNVAMFSLLFILFGAATAVATALLDRLLPRVTELRHRRYWYPYAVASAVALALLLLIPLRIGGVFVAAPMLVGVLALHALAHLWFPRAKRMLSWSPAVRRGARYLALGVPAVIGSVFLARSVLAIVR